MPFCSMIKSYLHWEARFGNATIICYICFMKNKNVSAKEEMGQAWEKWGKTWGEEGQVKLSGLAFKTAPDVTAGPDRTR